MNETEFEDFLRGMRPAEPSLSLEGRIAASLNQAAPVRRPSWLAFAMERLMWAGVGAAALWVIAGVSPVRPFAHKKSADPEAHQVAAAPATDESAVAEVRLPWADEGVKFLDDNTPARVIRRTVIERHPTGVGGAELRVPREDLIVLPVSFR